MASFITSVAHGLAAGDRVYFGNLVPTDCGIVEGQTYYVLAAGLTADTFEFSETLGGTPFALTFDVSEGIVSKTPVYTAITDSSDVMAPPTAPAAPGSVVLTSAVAMAPDGTAVTHLTITIVQPTTATLRHTIVTVTGGGNTSKVVIPVGQTVGSIASVVPGVSYTAAAIAYDTFGLASAETDSSAHVAAGDVTAPAQVTGAAAFGAILGLIVAWNPSTEADLAHYEVQLDSSNTFATATTYKSKSNVFNLQQVTPGTWYFRIRAVDLTGNAGTYSSTVSATSRTVQTADLTDALITTAKLVAGAVTSTELAAAAVTAAKIAVDAVTASAIAAGEVGNSELASGAVTASKITAGTITSNEIAALTIVAANIAAGTIVASKIAAGTITANEIAALTIVAANIAAGTITGAKIAAGTITASNIAADTITANEIAASAITSSELAAGAVIAGKITAGAIATADLNASCSIQLVSNSGATVVINSSGITITNGAFSFVDNYGTTTMDGGGFGPEWVAFIRSGLYNNSFTKGLTTDIPVSETGSGTPLVNYLASLTSNLPYWVVAASGGELKQIADATASGGKALNSAATVGGQTNRWYQDIPVISGKKYLARLNEKWTVAAGDFALNHYYSWRDSTHAIIGSRVGSGLTVASTRAAYALDTDTQIPAAVGAAPANAVFLRYETEIVHNNSNTTYQLSDVSLIEANADRAFRGAAAWRSTTQTLTSGIDTAISFDSEYTDTEGMFTATSTNITIKIAGFWRLTGRMGFTGAAGGTRRVISVRVNGTTPAAPDGEHTIVTGGNAFDLHGGVTIEINLAVGDVITLVGNQNSGGNLTVKLGAMLMCEFMGFDGGG